MTQSKVQIDPNLEARIRELREGCTSVSEGLHGAAAGDWMRAKTGWSRDLDDCVELGKPYDRTAINEQLQEALRSGEDSGTTGDAVAGSLQIEMLSQLERATRSRHCCDLPRMMALHAGRAEAHGTETGVLGKGVVDFLRLLLREGAS